MLAPSEVIDKARIYLGEVVPEFAALEPNVEEMVLAPDSSEWRITFSARIGEDEKPLSLAHILRQRVQKIVSVGPDGTLMAVRNPPPF